MKSDNGSPRSLYSAAYAERAATCSVSRRPLFRYHGGLMATDAIASIHEESGHFSRARSQMRMDEIEWRYQGNSVRVGMTWHGQGASVLMLPALSSISTRSEMWPLQQRLGSWFTTLAIDWVGFGDRPRPPLRWSPEIYRRFLAYLLDKVVPRPFATIARTC